MFKGSTDRNNFAMWCRMLHSRAYVMAEARNVNSMRLKTI